MRIVFAVGLAMAVACATAAAGDGPAGFSKACKTCHGAQGQGNPAIAKALKVTIPDLSSKEVQSRSDEDLKKVVTSGKGKMKPVSTLSADEVKDVVAFLRTLKK